MDEQQIAALIAALALAVVHLLGGGMRLLKGVPRSRWLSAFGGVSVAYVFAHLLPELADSQRAFERGDGADAGALASLLEDHVYLTALAGLIVFYAVNCTRWAHAASAVPAPGRTAPATTLSG